MDYSRYGSRVGPSSTSQPSGFYNATVKAVDGDRVSVVVPRLFGDALISDVPVAGPALFVDDPVYVSFIEGRRGSLVAFPSSASAAVGDITAVTAGTNLNGGGSSGDVTLNLDEDVSITSLSATGSVSGGSLTIDTDVLVVDAVNNRVGIGTTSPADTLEVAGDVTITGGLTVQGAGGYDMQVFTSSGSFTKATYPWARNVRVRVVGGGGGSGAAVATSSSQISVGGSGGAGAYAESVIAVSSLAASETVTVGTGGAAGTSGSDGGDGTASSFGTHAAANGGTGGKFGSAQTTPGRSGNPGQGGGATAGDLQIRGGGGEGIVVTSTNRVETTVGGASMLAPPRRRQASTTTTGGLAGVTYGGGSNGPANAASQAARDGGAGADGIVIVEIFG